MSQEMAPESVCEAVNIVFRYEKEGVCPSIRSARHACVWTCVECKRTMPATLGPGPENARVVVRCSMWKGDD
jgi:hypothetical protein